LVGLPYAVKNTRSTEAVGRQNLNSLQKNAITNQLDSYVQRETASTSLQLKHGHISQSATTAAIYYPNNSDFIKIESEDNLLS